MLLIARRVAVGLVVMSVVGFAVGLALDLPAQLAATPKDHLTVADALVTGTAVSSPVAPLVVLLLAHWLTSRTGWQRVLGTVLLALVGAVMTVAILGEWRHGPPFDGARTAVFLLFNVVGLTLAVTLAACAVIALVRSRRTAAAT